MLKNQLSRELLPLLLALNLLLMVPLFEPRPRSPTQVLLIIERHARTADEPVYLLTVLKAQWFFGWTGPCRYLLSRVSVEWHENTLHRSHEEGMTLCGSRSFAEKAASRLRGATVSGRDRLARASALALDVLTEEHDDAR